MRKGVTEHVWVKVLETCLLGTTSQHLANAVVGHIASAADPELGTAGKAMLASFAEVALDGLANLVAERTGTGRRPLPRTRATSASKSRSASGRPPRSLPYQVREIDSDENRPWTVRDSRACARRGRLAPRVRVDDRQLLSSSRSPSVALALTQRPQPRPGCAGTRPREPSALPSPPCRPTLGSPNSRQRRPSAPG